MATLTSQERNVLRKVVRILDMRENMGQPAYDASVDSALTGLREILQPTERYVLHVPEEYAFKAKVVWYETHTDGKKHLFLQIIEEAGESLPQQPVQAEGEQ